jgi:large subunit ribosomal protein L9
MAQTQVILLERVENLGQMGDVVAVRPGYARNFLLPQRKALRANKDNVAYFEAQKKQLEATNIAKRSEAEKIAAKAKDMFVNIIRQAAEGGQLYGSVNTRDIADAITAAGVTVDRAQVRLNQSFKTIGLFAVDVFLHPEVKIVVTANIARSDEEAKIQKKTGKAMVATDPNEAKSAPATAEKGAFLDQAALDAETAANAEAAAAAAAEEAARAEKSAKRATKKAAKKSDEPDAEGAEADTAE